MTNTDLKFSELYVSVSVVCGQKKKKKSLQLEMPCLYQRDIISLQHFYCPYLPFFFWFQEPLTLEQ